MENLQGIVLWYVTLLVSLVCHEAAHALVAMLGGDRTAYLGGQVTLNPIPHIRREPFGTVILPLVMLFSSGWCMGYAHAPVDAGWAHRHPKRAAMMSAAGPLANIVLAGLALAALKTLVVMGYASDFPASPMYVSPHEPSGAAYAIARIASVFLLLNVVLAVLNLIPFPPLDGAGVVAGLFPNPMERFYAFVRTQPFLILLVMAVLVFGNVLHTLYKPVIDFVTGWI